MRAHERQQCLEILDAGMEIGPHDTTRLINYTNALEQAAIKMWWSVSGHRKLTAGDVSEIQETMKVALPPGSV